MIVTNAPVADTQALKGRLPESRGYGKGAILVQMSLMGKMAKSILSLALRCDSLSRSFVLHCNWNAAKHAIFSFDILIAEFDSNFFSPNLTNSHFGR
jgi:hypothetical protein